MKRSMLCFLKDSSSLSDVQNPRKDWEVTFVTSRQSAFDALAKIPFGAVVTDMSRTAGAENDFLTEIAKRHPNIARVLLFNSVENTANTKSRGVADQCVPSPCTPAMLVTVVERAQMLHQWLADPSMKRLLPRIRKLPSVPTIYLRLVQLLQSPQSDLNDVAQIMREDFVMTAKLLQMVNSPFFGLKRAVSSLDEAVTHLGFEQTKSLVLLAQVFSNYVEDKSSSFSLDQLWRHLMGTAKLARRIVNFEMDDPVLAETAFTAGLLHDVGKLLFAVNCAKEYDSLVAQADLNDMPYVDAERNLLGTSHAELGACVLGTWGLPAEILESIAFHHTPSLQVGKGFCPLTAVHVANVFEHGLSSRSLGIEACNVDHAYLAGIGCEDRLPSWRELCFAPLRQIKIPA